MPVINFDKDALTRVSAAIYEAVDGPDFIEKLRALKKNIDWNPFNEDGDEHVGPWAEIRQNFRLVGDVAMSVVHVAERIVVEGQGLSAPQKHEACVQALDDILRLPWYLEPLDGPVLDMVVATAVAAMNSLDWLRPGNDPQVTINAVTDKIDMTQKLTAINPEKVVAARREMAGAFREIG